MKLPFNREILNLNAKKEVDKIVDFINEQVRENKKDGIVVGLSGGIDSALACALSVEAVGKENVFGLIMPEKDSNPVSKEYALNLANILGIDHEVVDITPTLEAFGTYEKRDRIISEIYPDYDPDSHRIKITLPENIIEKGSFNFYVLTLEGDEGVVYEGRLNKRDLNGIIAATDSKQRTRMMHVYYHAEKLNRFVCGTTNRPEILQGFFVKYGDGGVDIEPLAHLYKCQIYQLSKHLGIPQEIMDRMPSPDTFNSYVGDEEFFFRMPYDMVDLLLYSWEYDVPMSEVCEALDLEKENVERVYRDFESKFKATSCLRKLPPSLLPTG